MLQASIGGRKDENYVPPFLFEKAGVAIRCL